MKQKRHLLLIFCLLSITFLYANVVKANDPATVNLAQGKPTKQGSTGWRGASSRAVDGNRSGNWKRSSVTHTGGKNRAENNWWQVDLEVGVPISEIKVFNCTNCCSKRLRGAKVYISNTPYSSDLLGMQEIRTLTGSRDEQTIVFDKPVYGRFVVIKAAGSNYLSLAEVEVLGIKSELEDDSNEKDNTNVNLARSKPTTQGATGWGGVSFRAVDGNKNGDFPKNSVTHTDIDNNWWQVDLGADVPISEIKVFNRTDCCSERLKGAKIYLSNTAYSGSDFSGMQELRTLTSSSNEQTIVLDDRLIHGRFVVIKAVDGNPLSLAEVEVFGKKLPDRTAPIISLMGASTVSTGLGNIYNDEGATADDNREGTITDKIVVSSSVDTKTLGTYPVTYDVTDGAGNNAIQVTRTVNVILPQDSGENLAKGKPARQGSTGLRATASRAIDGNRDGNIHRNSVSYTSRNNWWELNLKADVAISEIKVFSCSNCEQLKGVKVYLSNTPYKGDFSGMQLIRTLISNKEEQTIILDSTLMHGQYIVIKGPGVRNLALAEVEVYGTKKADTKAPVISLIGDSKFSIKRGSMYTDEGATARDDLEGVITNKIVVNNSVDINKLGTYTVTYNVSDATGNKAMQVTRTVNVVLASRNYPYLPVTVDDKIAISLLNKTTFGARKEEVEALKDKGIEYWVNEQLAMSYESDKYLKDLITLAKKVQPQKYPASLESYLSNNGAIFIRAIKDHNAYQVSSWYKTALMSKDQLRHRMAYALSQIVVLSTAGFKGRTEAVTTHFNILAKHAFGNYRDLLIEVTHSAGMGIYLTYNGSMKATGNRTPDENYARELMQLFTLGLDELNLDGTVKRDSEGHSGSTDTYGQTDVNELAKVFTGWDLRASRKYGFRWESEGDYIRPLEFTSKYHDYSAKTVLGQSIQAGNDATQDIAAAIDILMAHPNVAPFVSKKLIMRLVKSNPSSAYVERVASVFNDNGEGVKGDLKAVLKAIILDEEVYEKGAKKFKEPLLGYTGFLRSFYMQPLPRWILYPSKININDEMFFTNGAGLKTQGPGRAATVFNFYDDDFMPSSEAFQQASLVAPEVQKQSNSSLMGFSNQMRSDLLKREKSSLLTKYNNDLSNLTYEQMIKNQIFYYRGQAKFLIDTKDEYELMERELDPSGNIDMVFPSFNGVTERQFDISKDVNGVTDRDRALRALIVHLDNKLTGGRLGETKREILYDTYIKSFYSSDISSNKYNPIRSIYTGIIQPLIMAIATSEDFMVEE